LKGETAAEIMVSGEISRLSRIPYSNEWLLFLVNSDRRLWIGAERSIVLADEWLPAMNFGVVTGRETILQAVRDAVAILPSKQKLDSLCLSIPPSSPAYQKGMRHRDLLRVPLVPRLEELARQWVNSNDSDFRRNGIHVLEQFKSPENLQFLKGLLGDSENFVTGAQQRELVFPLSFVTIESGGTRIYPIRQAAYDVLRRWNVDVPAPVTEEPVAVSRWLVALSIAIPLLVVIVGFLLVFFYL